MCGAASGARGSRACCSAATSTGRRWASSDFGRIGQAVARRCEGFGCEVLHTSRGGGVEIGDLLERSDFVTLHAPLTPETQGLIDDPRRCVA